MTEHPIANIPIGGVKCFAPLLSKICLCHKKPTNEASWDVQESSRQQLMALSKSESIAKACQKSETYSDV